MKPDEVVILDSRGGLEFKHGTSEKHWNCWSISRCNSCRYCLPVRPLREHDRIDDSRAPVAVPLPPWPQHACFHKRNRSRVSFDHSPDSCTVCFSNCHTGWVIVPTCIFRTICRRVYHTKEGSLPKGTEMGQHRGDFCHC